MRLYTVAVDGREMLAVERSSGRLYLLSSFGFDYKDMNDLIDRTDRDMICSISNTVDAIPEDSLLALDLEHIHICPPIPRTKQDIICLGVNYRDHRMEAEQHMKVKYDTVYSEYFSKRVNRMTGTNEPIMSHSDLDDTLDYEVELAVVLGKDAYKVSKEEALDYVFGYSVFNDVSLRNLQTRHYQFYIGKSAETFCVMGPCIVTADEIEDVQALDIKCRVNGELRQDSNTSFMIQTVAGAISEVTESMYLLKGSVMSTGTPGGVAVAMKDPKYLKPGDVIECEIEKIGVLRNVIE